MGLVQATNGELYGTTQGGGASGFGTVFRLSVGLGPFVETQTTSGKVGAAVKILWDWPQRRNQRQLSRHCGCVRSSFRFLNHCHGARRRDQRKGRSGNTQRHAFEQRSLPGATVNRRLLEID